MSLRLPPLNALRAFEAVARCGSVRAAAAELSVTPAAVSQQVRVLEAHFGLALFERSVRRIVPTERGRELFQGTSRHLFAIAEAAARLRPGADTVQVSAVPSFAARWLVPRLQGFMREHPGVDVRVDADPTLVDLTRSGVDLGVREGAGRYPDHESRCLFPLDVWPVAGPAYARRTFGRGRPGWSTAALLHESTYPDLWARWIEQAGIERADRERGMYFSHAMLTLTAAIQDQGVALASPALVAAELADGRLVVVDRRPLRTGLGYHLAWPRPSIRTLSRTARLLRDWIVAQAETEASRLDGLVGATARSRTGRRAQAR